MKGEKVFQFFFVEPRFPCNLSFSTFIQPFKGVYLAQPFFKGC